MRSEMKAFGPISQFQLSFRGHMLKARGWSSSNFAVNLEIQAKVFSSAACHAKCCFFAWHERPIQLIMDSGPTSRRPKKRTISCTSSWRMSKRERADEETLMNPLGCLRSGRSHASVSQHGPHGRFVTEDHPVGRLQKRDRLTDLCQIRTS